MSLCEANNHAALSKYKNTKQCTWTIHIYRKSSQHLLYSLPHICSLCTSNFRTTQQIHLLVKHDRPSPHRLTHSPVSSRIMAKEYLMTSLIDSMKANPGTTVCIFLLWVASCVALERTMMRALAASRSGGTLFTSGKDK